MKHSQVQLASKRNFIRLMALAMMLVFMVCCTALWVNAANEEVVFGFKGTDFTFNAKGGYWETIYRGSDKDLTSIVTVKVDGKEVDVKSAILDDPNVSTINAQGEFDLSFVTVVYGENDQTTKIPVRIKPVELKWNDGVRGTAEVEYNVSGDYTNVAVTVPTDALNLDGIKDTIEFETSTVSFKLEGCGSAVAFANVTLNNGNYTVDPLPVDVTVKPATITSVTWGNPGATFTFGDEAMLNIKALGNGNVPMTVLVKVGEEWLTLADAFGTDGLAVGTYELSVAPVSDYYTVTATVAETITITKATYNVVLNNGEFVDNGEQVKPEAGFGYALTVTSKDGAIIPESILSAITYVYTNAQGQKVAKVTEPGVYTVKAVMPTLDNAEIIIEKDTATLTVLSNYKVVTTPDGAIVIIGKNGISDSVVATVTVPEKVARPALRGLDAYKAYTLTITGADDQTFSVRIPVSQDLVGKNLLALTPADLYIYDGSTGTKEVASNKYTVSLSEDGSYYIISGYAPAGEITFMIAPEYDTPFWGSALGISLIVLLAIILVIILPMYIGMMLIRIERSGKNPVISVETTGNVPAVEPVVIPDKVEDPDAVIEAGLDEMADALAEEIAAETEEYDVDATDAVADAMAQFNEELAEIDLAALEAADIAEAEAAASELADQLVLELMDQVAAADNGADISDEVEKAVADAMAENFNESADATDAIALITEEEPAEEEPAAEVVEEAPVEEMLSETEETEEEDDESFGGFGSMPLDYIDAIAEAERYAEMLEQERRGEVQLVTRYRRSYQSRLAQSQGNIQDYYNVIKNLLLSYKGVKSRISWNFESFNVGRTPLAKFNAKTRTLYVYIALSPEELADTKYNFADMSEKKKYAAVPVLLKVKGDRKFKHALELITKLCEEKLQLPKKKNFSEEDYRTPFKTTEELVNEGTIKMMVAAIPVAAPAAEESVVEEAPVEEAIVEEAEVEETPAVAAEEATEEVVAEEAAPEVAEEAVAEEAVEEVTEEAVEETNENA